LAIIRELLTNTIAACSVLGLENTKYKDVLGRLHPYNVGAQGDLNEWYYDWKDYDPLHRHQSHLIGLYPGNHLLRDGSMETRRQLADACEQTLIQKGDETTGWSTGWRINLWARLKKAEQAYHIYRKLLTYVEPSGGKAPNYQHGGGTYANLFDAHPPFQIDGNFGGVAGVCEMLVQSHSNSQFDNSQFTIHLLPALPEAWKNGSVKGLCARGGYVIDMTWKDGQVTELQIYGKHSGKVTVRYNGKEREVKVSKRS
jgi:alpha-L-fucosidase 2